MLCELAASEKHVTRKENQLAGINSIVDQAGNRTAAVLPLPEYGALLDQLLDDAALGRLVRQIPPD